LITALATRLLEGPWNDRILISFYKGDVGPILREEIFAHPVQDDGTVPVLDAIV
jgi:hypothetical protein